MRKNTNLRFILLLTGLVLGVTAVFTQQLNTSSNLVKAQNAIELTTTPSMTPTATGSSTPTSTPTATATVSATMTATISSTATASPTPTVTVTVTLSPTATATTSPTPTATVSPTPPPTSGTNLYLPIVAFQTEPPASLLVPIRVSATPPIDFEAARADAQAQGLDIAFNKIGFHVGLGGNTDGLDAWMEELDAAGIPFFLKTANNAEPIYEAQQIMQASGVPHTLVYRDARPALDIPAYHLEPDVAAAQSWQLNRDAFPPELDPSLVWIETTNEPNKNEAAWLAEFALHTAQMAVEDGFKYAAFGWSGGEPELTDWESPEMLAFLQYAGEHPDQVALALHEYSFDTDEIGYIYPWLVGRFQMIFEICDENNIPRPTVLITEWGWEFDHVPTPQAAMEDINWASWMYAAYPQVKGAGLWYLGFGEEFGDIHNEAQKLIAPVKDYSLSNYFILDPQDQPIDTSLLAPMPPTRVRIDRIK